MLDIPQNNLPFNGLEQRIAQIELFLMGLNYKKIKNKPLAKALGTQTIGTTQVTIAHGLNQAPNIVIVQMTSAGTIWQSTTADATNIYLKADSAGRTCNVEAIYLTDNLR
jgi:hypothetical protein